jgi:hypothetical protein
MTHSIRWSQRQTARRPTRWKSRALANRRLADECDAAQASGRDGRRLGIPDGNTSGLISKQIHEAGAIRDGFLFAPAIEIMTKLARHALRVLRQQ